jgi:RNA polymerase sigma-70 factor (ECF subfamily)
VIRAREDRWFERFRRTGDPRVLAKVFDRTAPELWRVAAHLCRDRHAAEDAVQGTFLVAIEAKDDWDGARPLLPWLLGLLANRVRDLRWRALRVLDGDRLAERLGERTGERDPAQLAEHGEFGAAFCSALQRLEEPYRSTLERHLVHGAAAHEIAAELGIPAGTVRMRLHRGLEQLRQKLPQGFVAGGAVAIVPSAESLAAMREVVLAKVPGGTLVAAVGAGHVVVGVIGVILMKKVMLAVVACCLVALGLWSFWPEFGGGGSAEAGAEASVVAVTVTPMAPREVAAESPATAPVVERREAKPVRQKAAEGQLRVVLRHGGTGGPVSEVRLQVVAGLPGDSTPRDGRLPSGYPAQAQSVQYGKTGEDGVAVFTVPIGTADVIPSILQSKPLRAEVANNAVTEMVVEFPVRVRADVEVVDARGQPLAGARILGRTRVDVGFFVERELGRTGPDGHWREQFLESGVPVRAVLDGYVASRPVDLHDKQQRAKFVLADGPSAIAGTVFDRNGQPAPGAQVAIQPRVAGVDGQRPMAFTTDAQGRFESAHVPPGPITVLAVVRTGQTDFRTARADVVAVAGQHHSVDVRLDAGARIVFTLIGADGLPLKNQEVNAAWLPERELNHHVMTTPASGLTDEQGRCVLEDLVPGEYTIYGYGATWRKEQKITLAAGQEYRCDWSLAPAVYVEVRVVDEAQKPLDGWRVELQPGAGTVRAANTEDDGVVRFEAVADEPYEVTVRKQIGVVFSIRTKVANNQRNVVVVPKSAMPEGSIRGSVHLAAGIDAASVYAGLSLHGDPGSGSMRRALSEGGLAFQFTNLPAGVYELSFRREGDAAYLARPRPVEVSPAQVVDLGVMELRGPTDVRVEVACRDAGVVNGLMLDFALPDRARSFMPGPQTADARVVTVQGLPAGRYELLVWGADIAPEFMSIVAAGEPLNVSCTPQRAIATTFHVRDAGRMAELKFLKGGVELLTESVREPENYTRGFLPGNYRIECTTTEGLRGSADFTVGAVAGPAIEIALTK